MNFEITEKIKNLYNEEIKINIYDLPIPHNFTKENIYDKDLSDDKFNMWKNTNQIKNIVTNYNIDLSISEEDLIQYSHKLDKITNDYLYLNGPTLKKAILENDEIRKNIIDYYYSLSNGEFDNIVSFMFQEKNEHNYREIIITSNLIKYYELIILSKIEEVLNKTVLNPNKIQYGFNKDLLNCRIRFLEKYKEICNNHKKQMIYIDLKDAYHNIKINRLINILNNYGIVLDKYLISSFRRIKLYKKYYKVRSEHLKVTDINNKYILDLNIGDKDIKFEIDKITLNNHVTIECKSPDIKIIDIDYDKGLFLGSKLHDYLFCIYLEYILLLLKEQFNVEVFCFVDDIFIFLDLDNYNIEEFNIFFQKYDFNINKDKTIIYDSKPENINYINKYILGISPIELFKISDKVISIIRERIYFIEDYYYLPDTDNIICKNLLDNFVFKSLYNIMLLDKFNIEFKKNLIERFSTIERYRSLINKSDVIYHLEKCLINNKYENYFREKADEKDILKNYNMLKQNKYLKKYFKKNKNFYTF